MRVKELIEELERQDPESQVQIGTVMQQANRIGQIVPVTVREPIIDVKHEITGAVIYIA